MKIRGVATLLLCLVVPSFVAAESSVAKNDQKQAQRAFIQMSKDEQIALLAQAVRDLQPQQTRLNPSCTTNSECGNGICDPVTSICKCNAGFITPTPDVNGGAACSYQAHSRLRATLLNSIVLGMFGAGNFDIGNNGLGAGALTLFLTGAAMIVGGAVVAAAVTKAIGVPMIIVGIVEILGSVWWGWVAESILIATGQRKDGRGQDTVW